MGEIRIINPSYPVTKSNAESSLLTRRSGLNTFPRVGLFACFPFPFPFSFSFSVLSRRFRDDGGLASGSSVVSPATLERRGRSWIVVVLVIVVIPDLIDAVSEALLPATNTGDVDVDADADNANADTDADVDDVALGDPGELWNCSGGGGDGVPPHDSRTVTVDVIVFAVGAGMLLLCVGAEDAMAPLPFSSRARFCLSARCFPGYGPSSPPSSLRTSIARATPRPRRPSTVMSERARTMPPALTVLVVMPVLWNGSTPGAVRRAGESTERRPMFAPGKMSLGRRPCSDRVTLEKVEDEAVGRMRLWG
jgi:hypothetical protein